jgi:hypothetical protein
MLGAANNLAVFLGLNLEIVVLFRIGDGANNAVNPLDLLAARQDFTNYRMAVERQQHLPRQPRRSHASLNNADFHVAGFTSLDQPLRAFRPSRVSRSVFIV